ncbi:hypothetical protein M8J76_012599 [Diaphorina citri]|nr:hypothetical protein M8J76_012599 [Diaphorina citri]
MDIASTASNTNQEDTAVISGEHKMRVQYETPSRNPRNQVQTKTTELAVTEIYTAVLNIRGAFLKQDSR